MQRELLEGVAGEGSAALAEYRRRFVCRRPGASCLTDPAAGASLVMQRELCGASLFQVGCTAWSPYPNPTPCRQPNGRTRAAPLRRGAAAGRADWAARGARARPAASCATGARRSARAARRRRQRC